MSRREDEDEALLGSRGDPTTPTSGKRQSLFRACVAELIVTMLFVLLGVTSVANNTEALGITFVPAVALAHGFLIFVLVAMTAEVSGGHINPAVSLGVWLAGDISFVKFILYFLSQLIGACIGAALALGLNGDEMMLHIDYGTHHPSPKYNDGQAMGIEMFTTFVVVTTVLANAVDRKGFKSIVPLCIGLSVAAGILVSGDITGGSMNPARSFGPAIASLHLAPDLSKYYDAFWKDQWIYFVGPLLGGALAAVNYRFVFASHTLKPVRIQ